jgi:cytoskeletal protein RodZ
MERNEFTKLPGGMYRKAYVRTVAVEVGLNPDEIAADYSAFHAPIELAVPSRYAAGEDVTLQQLTPPPSRSIATLAVLALLAAAWFGFQPDPVRQRPGDANGVSESVAAAASLDRGSDPIAHQPESASTVAATDSRPPAVPLKVQMAASDWCWVAAESDGARVLYRLLKPGEQVVLEGERKIALRLGNAGSVTVSINDGPRRSPGSTGEVVDLEVTPDNLEDLQ